MKKNVSECMNIEALAALAALVVLVLCGICGCSTADANPASRVTSARYGNIWVFGPGTVTIGDGALASADSSGSTETASPTQTPTNTTDVPVDVRYNDAIAGASAASRGVLETLSGKGLESVLSLMKSKATGDVAVTKTDGTSGTVHCENGQCTFVDPNAK